MIVPEPLGAFRPAPPSPARGARSLVFVVGLVCVATAAAAVIGDGNPALVAAPVVLTTVLYALCTVPLRWSAATLAALMLSLPLSTDAEKSWPIAPALLGDLLKENIDVLVPASKLKVSGLELLLLLLLVVATSRRVSGLTLDTRNRVAAPTPLRDLALLFLLSVGFAAVNGLAHGGAPATVIWHARPLLHYVALYFLFQAAFRGRQDHALLGGIVVAAALVKAMLGFYYLYVVAPTVIQGSIGYITNHFDSILFSGACLVLFTSWLECPSRARLARLVVIMPVLLWAMRCNNRRLVWVELAFGLAAVFLVGARTRAKRFLLRIALVIVPVLLVYGAAGWTSNARFFAPVKMLRSMTDTKADRSAWDREVEDWNIMTSMWERPLSGRGFGFEYTEWVKGDDLSSVFPMYRAVPHNGVLGLLLFAGALAFTGIWLFFAGGIFFALRAYRFARTADDRAAALCCMASVLIVLVQWWGDLGVGATQSKLFSSVAVAMAGKLAIEVGAWPAPARRRLARGAALLAPAVGLGGGPSADRPS